MAEQWLGVPAAAEALGVDAAAVRKQIAEELLTVRQGDAGLEVLVTVADSPAAAPVPTEPSAAEPIGREAVFEAMLASEAEEAEWEQANRARFAPAVRNRNIALSDDASTAAAAALADPEIGDDTRFQPSDLVRERLASARAESNRLRQVSRFAFAGAGTPVILGVLLTTSYAVDASRAEGALQAHQGLIEEAKADAARALDGELVMKRENAALAERLANAQTERDAARKQLEDQRKRLTELEVEKRQAETALQAALVSLYQYQPEEVRTAVERLRAGAE